MNIYIEKTVVVVDADGCSGSLIYIFILYNHEQLMSITKSNN